MRTSNYTCPKNLLTLLAGVALLVGCASPDINYSMDDAKDVFKSRQLANGGKLETGADEAGMSDNISKPRRKLVQFRYAPNSFENPEFQAFLQRLSSESAYVGDVSGGSKKAALTDADKNTIAFDRANRRHMLVTKEMQQMQGQLNAFGMSKVPSGWQVHSQLNFKAAPLTMVLQRLSQQADVQIQLSDRARASKLRISGQYSGDLLSVLQQLSVAHGLQVRVGIQDQRIHVIHLQDATLQTYPVAEFFNPFEFNLADEASVFAVEAYRKLVSTLSTGDVAQFNARLGQFKPPLMQGLVNVAYERLNRGAASLNQKLRNFDQETLAIQNGAIPNLNLGDKEISAAVLSKGLLDRSICPGNEVVTEKLFVYYEAPKELVGFLDKYFKANPNSVSLVPPPGSAPSGAVAVAPIASASAPDGTPVGGAPVKKPRNIEISKEADERCIDDANKLAFKVVEDPTGVIVTGTVSQIELAVRLTDDVDVQTKQVLAEVFLVEVQKNWARTIETKITRSGSGGSISVGSVSNVVDATKFATASGYAGMQGRFIANGGDVNAFINLLETNSVGRNISSPTLIAKNGEEAAIEKVVTLRKTIANPQIVGASPAAGGGNAPVTVPNNQVQKLDVPLKLKIKPTINQHNKHVTLKFDYEETILNPNQEADSSPIEKGTTKNSITTTLETAPGEVVVLAGLFKEANSKNASSVPGLSGAGLLRSLFGASDGLSTSSTELLVFIKPTVLEPRTVVSKASNAR
jgi:hypothetical protein